MISLGQNNACQLDGMTLDRVLTDKARGKDTQRPELQAMLSYVQTGDHVYIHSMDRLAQSLGDLEGIVKGLTGRGVSVTFTHQNLTFTGEDSSMSALIKERQRGGIALAKAKAKGNVYKGRKPSLDAAGKARLAELVAEGMPKAQIAKALGISRTTLYENLKA